MKHTCRFCYLSIEDEDSTFALNGDIFHGRCWDKIVPSVKEWLKKRAEARQ